MGGTVGSGGGGGGAMQAPAADQTHLWPLAVQLALVRQ